MRFKTHKVQDWPCANDLSIDLFLLAADGYVSIVCVPRLVQLMTQARMATESLEV